MAVLITAAMFETININYIISIFITGAVTLASVYHTILYLHRKTKLLAHYTAYLWCTCIYCTFRMIYPGPWEPLMFLNSDETLQMIVFTMYIRFMGTALDLDRQKEKYACFFVDISPFIIFTYIAVQIVFVNTDVSNQVYFLAKIIIRAYLLLLGLFMLISVMLNRKMLYYNYLAAGAIAMILFGMLSSIINLYPTGTTSVGPFSWLQIGFFTDVVFFSSAIGYRIKTEAMEKEHALVTILQQQESLQQKEIEQLQVVFRTREQERMRIAKDLHDDVGASLSSVHLYSELAGQLLDRQPAQAKDIIGRITDNTQKAMEEMGDIIWSISPSEDADKTITARIKNYGNHLLSVKNIACRYQVDDALSRKLVNIDARKNLLLIIKEALNNIAKYSNASQAGITMEEKENEVLLEITDNGSGFDSARVKRGNGLLNMENRCQLLGGIFSLESSPGKGSSIRCIFPVTRFSDNNVATNE